MDEKARAVLDAADWWLSTVQAMSAADEARRGTEDHQVDIDAAEVSLTVAVKVCGTPAGPTRFFAASAPVTEAGRHC
jgi:hypothetical protein